MDLNRFRQYLKKQKLDDSKIDDAINLINDFQNFLRQYNYSLHNAKYEHLHEFSKVLIDNKRNTFENYVHLLRFGNFAKNHQIILASMEILDGSEVMINFSKRLIKEFGENIRNEIFENLEVPPLGLHPSERPRITNALINSFTNLIGYERCTQFLADGLRDKYTESYQKDKALFHKLGDLDKFLDAKHQNFIQTLKKHQKEGTLFFTQEIDDSVIEYVKKHKSSEAGIREGNQVIITKIPYMTKQFLNETDEMMKKYYYCHCPWLREGFKSTNQPVDPIFCNCSAGYYKNYWEAIFCQSVKVDLLESVLKGDSVCKFALHVPEKIFALYTEL